MGDQSDEIVMTPLRGAVRCKVISIKRVPKVLLDKNNVQHIAGGPYKGIVISKAVNERPDPGPSETQKNFTAVVGDGKATSREWRELRFWFQPESRAIPQVRNAITDTFFKELMQPKDFPKDYIGFMKRVLTLVKQYSAILKVELEMRPLGPEEAGPTTIRKRKQITMTMYSETLTNGAGAGAGAGTGTGAGQVPSQEDIRVLLYSEDVSNEQLEETLLAAGYIRSPRAGALVMRRPGVHIQENIHVIIRQDIMSGVDLQQALYNAGYVPNPESGKELFADKTEDDVQRMLYNDTLTVDELNVTLAEAGFMRAPDAVFRQQPGSRGQEDLRTVLTEETVAGQELQQALYVAGYIPKSQAGQELFRSPGRSQDDIKNLLVKETLTFDELNIAIEEAGFVRAPVSAAVIRYPGVKGQEDLRVILKQEVSTGVELEQALWTVGYIPNPEAGKQMFTSPGRSQDDIRTMIYKDTQTFDELNIALEEAGFVRSDKAGVVVMQPGVRCQEDLRIVIKQEMTDGLELQDALFVAGFVARPEVQERVFLAKSEDDIKQLLHTSTLTIDELEIELQEAGFYRPPGMSVVNRAQAQEDMCFLINREIESGESLEDALYKAGYVKAPTKGAKVKRAPTISKKGWEMLWMTKKQRVLQILEDAYPNITTAENLMKLAQMNRNNIDKLLNELHKEKIIEELEKGKWIRVHTESATPESPAKKEDTNRTASMIAEEEDLSSEDEETKLMQIQRKHDIKTVTHIPHLPKAEQPTVALITLLYCEKLAVDAMMYSKTTYIRYKTEGEGQVYTVGKIGKHRVVATKLSRIGYKQDAMVAAGNAITRMLGTFGELEHVILVGVGGGVREDPSHSVCLGDIFISRSDTDNGPLYVHCTNSQVGDDGHATFMTQSWKPREEVLQKIVDDLDRDGTSEDWRTHFNEAMRFLKGGLTNFTRPAPETDKYYKPGEEPPNTMVSYGVIGSGKGFAKDNNLRRQFSLEYNCKVIDNGFQAVMQSIEGNRKDNFTIVRGVSDYIDGTQRREWQPYASLIAAAYAKTIILQLPVEEQSDSD